MQVPSASPLLSTSLWWSRFRGLVVGYGTVCWAPHPTTLTLRTMCRFFDMCSLVAVTSDTAHENKHRSVEMADVVHA